MNYTVRFLFLLFFQFYTWTSFALCDLKITSVDVVQPTGQDSNGEIAVVATGGQGKITFQITNSLQNETGTFTQLPRGYYFAKAKDENGCTAQFPNPFHIGDGQYDSQYRSIDTLAWFQYSTDTSQKYRWKKVSDLYGVDFPLIFNGRGMKADTAYYLQTCSFDLRKFKDPRFTFYQNREFSSGLAYIEFSTDGGLQWKAMPKAGKDFSNPYNQEDKYWGSMKAYYEAASFSLKEFTDESNVLFRFTTFIHTDDNITDKEWIINQVYVDEIFVDLYPKIVSEQLYFEDSVNFRGEFPEAFSINTPSPGLHYNVDIYLSKDTVIDAADSFLGRKEQDGNTSINSTILSSPQPQGHYYLLFDLDPDNLIKENNELNNLAYRDVYILKRNILPVKDNLNSYDLLNLISTNIPSIWEYKELHPGNYAWSIHQKKDENDRLTAMSAMLYTGKIDISNVPSPMYCLKYVANSAPYTIAANIKEVNAIRLAPKFDDTDRTGCLCYDLSSLDRSVLYSSQIMVYSQSETIPSEVYIDDLYIGNALPYFVIPNTSDKRYASISDISDSLFFQVNNRGFAKSAVEIDFYLSKDSVFGAEDKLEAQFTTNIVSGHSNIVDAVAINNEANLEKYFVFAIVDPRNKVEEIWENERITRFEINKKVEFKAPYFNEFEVSIGGWESDTKDYQTNWKWIEQSDSLQVPSGHKALMSNTCMSIAGEEHSVSIYSPIINISEIKHPVLHFLTAGKITLTYQSLQLYISYDYGKSQGVRFGSFAEVPLLDGIQHHFFNVKAGNKIVIKIIGPQPEQMLTSHLIDNFTVEEALVDLSVPEGAYTEATQLGTLIKLNHDLRNNGNVSSELVHLTYYLSTDKTLDASDIKIGATSAAQLKPVTTEFLSLRFLKPANAELYHYVLCTIEQDNTNKQNYTYKSEVGVWPFVFNNPRSLPYTNNFDSWENARAWYSEEWYSEKVLNISITNGFTYFPANSTVKSGLKSCWGVVYNTKHPTVYIESPEFDLSTYKAIQIELGIASVSSCYNGDGADIEYSIDGGNTWSRLDNSAAFKYQWAQYYLYIYGNCAWGAFHNEVGHAKYITSEFQNQKSVKFRIKHRTLMESSGLEGKKMCQLDYFNVLPVGTESVNFSVDHIKIDSLVLFDRRKKVDVEFNVNHPEGIDVYSPVVGYYLSKDNVLDSTDYFLSDEYYGHLNVADKNAKLPTIKKTFDLSAKLDIIDWETAYIIARIDPYNAFAEYNEADNYYYKYLDLRFRQPNLTAYINNNVKTVADSIIGYNYYGFHYTTDKKFTNVGVSLYLSQDSILNSTDIEIARHVADSIYPDGPTSYVSQNITLPSSFTPQVDEYWMIVKTDPIAGFDESTIEDNIAFCKVIFEKALPDLSIERVKSFRKFQNDSIWIPFKIKNNGISDSKPCTAKLDAISSTWGRINIPSIPSHTTLFDSVRCSYDEVYSVSQRSNNINITVDYPSILKELDETNNTGYTKLFWGNTDIYIDTLNIKNGQRIASKATTIFPLIFAKTIGKFDINDTITVDYYISRNRELTTEDTVYIRQKDRMSDNCIVPQTINLPNTVELNHFYIHFNVDSDKAYFEDDETNNWGSIEVFREEKTSDLKFAWANAPTIYPTSTDVQICDTIIHTGTESNDTFSITYYVSENNTLGAGDVAIATQKGVSLHGLPKIGTCYSVPLPSVYSHWMFYIISVLDVDNETDENNRDNNYIAHKIRTEGIRFVSICESEDSHRGLTEPGIYTVDNGIFTECINLRILPEPVIYYTSDCFSTIDKYYLENGIYTDTALNVYYKTYKGCDSVVSINIEQAYAKQIIAEDTIIAGSDISAFIVDGATVISKNAFSERGNTIADNPYGIYSVSLYGSDASGCRIYDTVVVIPKQCNVLKAYEIGTDSVCGPCSQIANRSNLVNQIDKAETLLENAVVGGAIGQYPQSAVDALSANIVLAYKDLKNINLDQPAIDNSVLVLKEAVFAFEASKILPAINTDKLSLSIANATLAVESAKAGTNPGEYPAASIEALNIELDKATAVLGQTGVTQEKVDNAIVALDLAIFNFEKSKIILSIQTEVLTKRILEAEAIIANSGYGTAPGMYPIVAKDLLQKSIASVNSGLKTATSQEDIDSLLSALTEAIAEFETSKNIFVAGSAVELAKTIALAEELTGSAVVGDKTGQFPQTALDKLNKAVTDAKQYTTNEYSQEAIDIAQKALSAAVAEFEASKIGFVAGSAVELAKTIALAEELIGSVVVGDKAGQFPQAALDKLNKAVNEAKSHTTNEYSQETIDIAQKALSAAVAEFEASKIGFVAGSAVELAKTIALAEELIGSAVVGDKAGQFPQAALDKLNKAVNEAKSYTTNEYSQETIDIAQKTLGAAVTEFEESKIGFVAGSTVELAKTIALAEELIGSAVVGDKAGQFPQATLDKLNKAVNDAKSHTTNEYSQEAIDNAQKALSAAVAEFEASKIGFVAGSTGDLLNAIILAERVFGAAVVGTNVGQYPQSALDKLSVAIVNAKQYTINEYSQESIDNATKALGTAIFDFEKSKVSIIAGNPAILIETIDNAKATYERIKSNTLPQTEIDAFNKVVVSADQFLLVEHTQSDIDSVVKTVVAAQQKLESINAKLLELKGLIQDIKKAIEIAENRGSADVIKLNNTLRDAEKVDLTAITSDELSALVTELTDALAEYESKPNKLSVTNVQNEAFIYPNPGKDNIKIFLDAFVGQIITLEIKSVGGQLFYYGYFNVERPLYVFDASTYIPGAYIVNISNGMVFKSEKLIIE